MTFSIQNFKYVILEVLDRLNIRDRFKGQYWGWKRRQKEYRQIVSKADYKNLDEGFISAAELDFYWIEGS